MEPLNEENIDQELNDRTIRVIMIPFFGIVIPNITGMIDNSVFTVNQLVLHYLYFMFIAFAIWHGNRYLLFRLRIRFSWLSQPMYKVLALMVSNMFYTVPIAVGLMTAWYVFAQHRSADWDVIFKATALCVVCVVFITHTYETVFLIKSWETDKTKSEALEKAKAQAELEALKNQIDPHFMFNSLNTLSHLIEQDPPKARMFNDNLAEVFRYILYNRNRNLVLLSEELSFAEKYFSLLKIRFGESIGLYIAEDSVSPDNVLIPPISLQILLENAIKHNTFSDQHPMAITIRVSDQAVVVNNPIRKKVQVKNSSRTGLENLNERYKLIIGQTIYIEESIENFTVHLPVLMTGAHAVPY
ncbi:histidine kinase [bacterium]|nr:histidine kinase [bacterium]